MTEGDWANLANRLTGDLRKMREERDRYKAVVTAGIAFIHAPGDGKKFGALVDAIGDLDEPEIKRTCNEVHPGQDVHHPEGH